MSRRTIEIDNAILESLKDGATITDACKAAGVSRVALYVWRKEDEAFDHHIQEALESRVQRVEDALYKSAINGNTTAQIFYLKNKADWKEVQHLSGKFEQNCNNPKDEDIVAVAQVILKTIK